MPRRFLTARWVNLVLVNYRVPAELLLPHVPPGAELDTPDHDSDLHLLSLVAFHFADSRVYGIPLPGASWFPELNLRFYVRHGEKRATVFLREFVPNALITLGARLLYQEPYYLALISHNWQSDGDIINITTHFTHRQQSGTLRVQAQNAPYTPEPTSEEHFLKEHYWGFEERADGRGYRYRVVHPVWRVFPVVAVESTINPGAILGGEWQNVVWETAYHSTLCVEGSAIELFEAEYLTA